MQKRIIADTQLDQSPVPAKWLNLEALADVEVSSEEADHPIEAALLPDFDQGWRAGAPGKQTMRLLFKQPRQIHCIQLEFVERYIARTQEYALRLSRDNGNSFREILRQQWNFSPEGTQTESEQHFMDFSDVSIIELTITPDLNNPMATASLEKMRVC